MSPMMLRFFSLVGIALAAASMQLKVRAEVAGPVVDAVVVPAPSLAQR